MQLAGCNSAQSLGVIVTNIRVWKVKSTFFSYFVWIRCQIFQIVQPETMPSQFGVLCQLTSLQKLYRPNRSDIVEGLSNVNKVHQYIKIRLVQTQLVRCTQFWHFYGLWFGISYAWKNLICWPLSFWPMLYQLYKKTILLSRNYYRTQDQEKTFSWVETFAVGAKLTGSHNCNEHTSTSWKRCVLSSCFNVDIRQFWQAQWVLKTGWFTCHYQYFVAFHKVLIMCPTDTACLRIPRGPSSG